MARALDAWANPSSPHAEGRAARALLEEARATIAEVLGWRHDVIFTSGASEADRDRRGTRAGRSGGLIGATEHAIVPHAMGEASTIIPVGANGLIDEDALDAMLADGPALVAIQHVNNETGVIQPLDRIGAAHPRGRLAAACRLRAKRGQAAACPMPISSPSAATSSAARRASACCWSAIWRRSRPVGGQEKGYRRGTAGCAGGAGLRRGAGSAGRMTWRVWPSLRRSSRTASSSRGRRRDRAKTRRGSRRSAPIACRARRSASLLVQFDLAGIAVSAGSACSSGSMKASPVLAAMGVPGEIASALHPGQLRSVTRAKPTSTASSANGAGSPSAPRPRRHDLPRLSGDDAGRARSRRGDAAVDRGEVRQSAFAVALGQRGGGGDRGRARAGRTGDRPQGRERRLHRAARPRRSTGRSRARSRRRPDRPQPDHHRRDRACRGARHVRMAGRAGHRPDRPAGRQPDGLLDLDAPRARARRARTAGRGDAGQQRDRRHPADRRDCARWRTRPAR